MEDINQIKRLNERALESYILIVLETLITKHFYEKDELLIFIREKLESWKAKPDKHGNAKVAKHSPKHVP